MMIMEISQCLGNPKVTKWHNVKGFDMHVKIR